MFKKILNDLLIKLASFILSELAQVVVTQPWKGNPDVPVESTPQDSVGTLSALSLSDRQHIFTSNMCKLIEYGNSLPGYNIALGEAWRPQFVQDFYVKTGKSRVNYSKHQDRLAIDLVVRVDGKYQETPPAYKPLADYWTSLHPDNRAGYNFKGGWDANHFEMK
mgnify:CR=1 FL=1